MANQNTKQAHKKGFSSKWDENNNGNKTFRGSEAYVGTGRNRRSGKKRYPVKRDKA
jgi:hypothetical protein